MEKIKPYKEKRVHPRVLIKIPVKYRLIEDPQGSDSLSEMRKKEIDTLTKDVSLGGMHIVSEQRLNVGSILALHFILPQKPGNLSAFGEVVWAKDNAGGVHFIALKDGDMESLKTALAKASSSS